MGREAVKPQTVLEASLRHPHEGLTLSVLPRQTSIHHGSLCPKAEPWLTAVRSWAEHALQAVNLSEDEHGCSTGSEEASCNFVYG